MSRSRKAKARPPSRMAMLASRQREERARMYVHEAGHAVVYHALGTRVVRIVTRPHPMVLVLRPARHGTFDVIAGVAGYLAERRAFPEERSLARAGAQHDVTLITESVKACSCEEERVQALMRMAGRILRSNWLVVMQLADELSKVQRQLEGEPLRQLLAGTCWY